MKRGFFDANFRNGAFSNSDWVAQATGLCRPATRRTEWEKVNFQCLRLGVLQMSNHSGRRVADRNGRVARSTRFWRGAKTLEKLFCREQSQNMTFVEFQRTKEKRRLLLEKRKHLFVSLGLRPLQIALFFSLCVSVISEVCEIWHYWPQAHLYSLIPAALLVLFWSFHFHYDRISFWLLAFVAGGSFLGSVDRLTTNYFHAVDSLGFIMIIVMTLVIYAKMKDPIFSRQADRL
jgi:hypothetical protein